jgi:hypothetical protein
MGFVDIPASLGAAWVISVSRALPGDLTSCSRRFGATESPFRLVAVVGAFADVMHSMDVTATVAAERLRGGHARRCARHHGRCGRAGPEAAPVNVNGKGVPSASSAERCIPRRAPSMTDRPAS